MFPDRIFLFVVSGIAVLIGAALPSAGWRMSIRHIAIALVVAILAVAGAIVFGAIMHAALFGEPVMID
jgi:hypothetical protein